MTNTAELLREIKKTYGREVFTFKELYEILLNCNFSMVEARQIVKESLSKRQLGKISFRKIRRNLPPKSSRVVIVISCK